MRVATNMFPESLLSQLSKLAQRQNRLQTQTATGQRVTLPEDDPAAMSRALGLQTESRTLAQYQRNLDVLDETATVSYTALKALKTISDRAGEIAVLADGLSSPDELQAYATELDQLIRQALQTANTRHRNDYLFAGTRTDQPPFVATTNADGQITAVTYAGNTEVAGTEIAAGDTLAARSPGANTTGSGPRGVLADSRTGADFFNHLIALRDHLRAGDTAAITREDLPHLGSDEENFLHHVAQIGVVQSRIETNRKLIADRSQAVEQLVSNETDADLAQTLVKLNEVQNAYRAALQSGSLILNQSLLDFLR